MASLVWYNNQSLSLQTIMPEYFFPKTDSCEIPL